MPANLFVHQSRVRFGDTDASGRIFYVSLLHHFDAAETEFMRSRGISYLPAANPHLAFPRVRIECDFSSALVFDDVMDIAVSVDRVGRSSFTLSFEVSVAGRDAARAKLTIVCLDREKQRAIPLPEKWREALTR